MVEKASVFWTPLSFSVGSGGFGRKHGLPGVYLSYIYLCGATSEGAELHSWIDLRWFVLWRDNHLLTADRRPLWPQPLAPSVSCSGGSITVRLWLFGPLCADLSAGNQPHPAWNKDVRENQNPICFPFIYRPRLHVFVEPLPCHISVVLITMQMFSIRM